MVDSSATQETTDPDLQVWNDFENQLDKLFLVLSSVNAPADTHSAESRHGLTERHMNSFLDACRALDSWFIGKRLQLSTHCPQLTIQEDLEVIRSEIARKEKLMAETKDKLKQYTQAISIVTDQVTKDLSCHTNS